jgi:ribonuclease P protein component
VTDCDQVVDRQAPPTLAKRNLSHQSLRSSRDFRRVLSDGKRRRKGGIVVVSSPGQAGTPRLGLLVSKRCGTAVTRNRIKRRLRSAAQDLEFQPGTDYVIIATEQVDQAPFSKIRDWLGRALEDLARD